MRKFCNTASQFVSSEIPIISSLKSTFNYIRSDGHYNLPRFSVLTALEHEIEISILRIISLLIVR